MSTLTMFVCDGCSATQEVEVDRILGVRPPIDWMIVEGPATHDELEAIEGATWPNNGRPRRHVCSPACLGVLGLRLAEDGDALAPIDLEAELRGLG